ncbi:MAG: hypothetical protein AAF927_06650 [Bacteroidota bacterium]
MQKTYLPFLILVAFSLFSCRPGFDLALLQAPPQQAELLPRLEFQMDAESFQTLYPDPFVEEDDGSGVFQIRPIPNTKLQDVKTIASRTLDQSICVPTGPFYGSALLKVSNASVNNRAQGLLLVSVASAFILNLVGMPIMKSEAILELELEIYDANGERLKSYIGQGFEKQWVGVYYGGGETHRRVHAAAVQEAMQDIQKQIGGDASTLKEVFLKVGTRQ